MSEKKHTVGEVIWRELMVPNVEKAKGFYGELFGWAFEVMPMPDKPDEPYTIIKCGGRGIGGMARLPSEVPAPPMWTSVVWTADVDKSIATVKKHGGQVYFGPVDLPGVGRYAHVGDQDKACIAMLTPAGESETKPERPSAGTFCWETLGTSDVERAKTFYADVFGWTPKAQEHMPGSLFWAGESMVADIQKAEGFPPCWTTYVVVDKLEAARERAEKLGAEIMVAEIPVPGVGRFAIIGDPDGAWLGLFEGS